MGSRTSDVAIGSRRTSITSLGVGRTETEHEMPCACQVRGLYLFNLCSHSDLQRGLVRLQCPNSFSYLDLKFGGGQLLLLGPKHELALVELKCLSSLIESMLPNFHEACRLALWTLLWVFRSFPCSNLFKFEIVKFV